MVIHTGRHGIRQPIRRSLLAVLSAEVAVGLATALAGCGGGGGSNGGTTGPTTRALTIDIAWPARSRVISGLSSALSARVTLQAAQANGTDITFTLNRNTSPAAYTGTYTSPQEAVIATAHPLTIVFFAQADGNGDTVGTVNQEVYVGEEGRPSVPVTAP